MKTCITIDNFQYKYIYFVISAVYFFTFVAFLFSGLSNAENILFSYCEKLIVLVNAVNTIIVQGIWEKSDSKIIT